MKSPIVASLALAAIFGVSLCIPLGETVPNAAPGAAKERYYMFSINNRVGICRGRKCATPKDNSTNNRFTVHGLMTGFKNGTGFEKNCNETKTKFDVKSLLRNVSAALESHMPTFKNETNAAFWQHEYDTYGTCVVKADSKAFERPGKYFDKIISLYKENNLTSIWKAFVASDTVAYSTATLKQALKNHTKVEVELGCRGKRQGYDVLEEIRFCYDVEFARTNCTSRKSTCTTGKVWYLKNSAATSTFSALVLVSLAAMALFNRNI